MHFIMLSAICFSLDQSKILSSGNGLKIFFSSFFRSLLDSGYQYQNRSVDVDRAAQCAILPTSRPRLFSKQQILDAIKLTEFADGKCEFDENGGNFSRRTEKTVGKVEIPFPTVFSKELYCRHSKTRVYLGKCENKII